MASKKILMVDDSKATRAMVVFTLRRAGYEVLEAEDGQQALALLNGDAVACVITDLNMPVMGGLELIRQLRTSAAHRATPILMLTTANEATKKEEGQSAGATSWLAKPFHPESLVKIVASLVEV